MQFGFAAHDFFTICFTSNYLHTIRKPPDIVVLSFVGMCFYVARKKVTCQRAQRVQPFSKQHVQSLVHYPCWSLHMWPQGCTPKRQYLWPGSSKCANFVPFQILPKGRNFTYLEDLICVYIYTYISTCRTIWYKFVVELQESFQWCFWTREILGPPYLKTCMGIASSAQISSAFSIGSTSEQLGDMPNSSPFLWTVDGKVWPTWADLPWVHSILFACLRALWCTYLRFMRKFVHI